MFCFVQSRDEVVTVHRQLKDNITGVKMMVEALKKEKDEAEDE